MPRTRGLKRTRASEPLAWLPQLYTVLTLPKRRNEHAHDDQQFAVLPRTVCHCLSPVCTQPELSPSRSEGSHQVSAQSRRSIYTGGQSATQTPAPFMAASRWLEATLLLSNELVSSTMPLELSCAGRDACNNHASAFVMQLDWPITGKAEEGSAERAEKLGHNEGRETERSPSHGGVGARDTGSSAVCRQQRDPPACRRACGRLTLR